MAKKLSSIAITHISLVKAGANGKSIIYKSANEEPSYMKTIPIQKSDEEGVVYGIVYAPNQIDTQGDYATADDIKKAAYLFMKNKNTANVDKDHSFDIEKAYIAQSWILKENDPVFPNESAGSWAVAIQLEDEALIKAVKDGEIAGISMAGNALKEEDEPEVKKSDLMAYIAEAFDEVLKTMNLKKEKNKESELKKEDLEAAIKTAMEPLVKTIGDLQAEVETLEKSDNETKEALKKSKQEDDVNHTQQKTANGGIL